MSANRSDTPVNIKREISFADTLAMLALVIGIVTLWFEEWKDICLITTLFMLIYISHLLLKWKKNNRDRATPEPIDEIPKNEIISRYDLEEDFKKILEQKREFVNDKIVFPDDKIYIVFGKSGVGKSFTTNETINGIISKNNSSNKLTIESFTIKEYESNHFKSQIRGFLNRQNDAFELILKDIGSEKIFILDQFESVFQPPLDGIDKNIDTLKSFFKQVMEYQNIRIFIIIREEWFASLFVFREYFDWNKHVIPIYGIKSDSKLWEEALDMISTFSGSNHSSEIMNGLSTEDNRIIALNRLRDYLQVQTVKPVEIQVVIKLLKFCNKDEKTKIDLKNFYGSVRIRGILKLYLKKFIDASDEPLNSARVLYSLSVIPQERRPLSIDEIVNITHLSFEEVNKVIDFFTDDKQKLIRRTSKVIKSDKVEVKFDWLHDHLAELFHEMSGSLLNPHDRDNISFFWYQLKKEGDKVDLRNEQIKPSSNPFSKNEGRKLYGKIVFILSIILLTLRSLSPTFGYSNWPAPFSENYNLVGFERIDIPFAFVALSLFLWALYVYWLHKNLLVSIEEKGLKLLLSKTLPLFSLLCVIATSLKPEFWLIFTGLGGLPVGIKFLQLSETKIKSKQWIPWNKLDGQFKKFGQETTVNCFVLIAIGYYYSLIYGGNGSILKNDSILNVGVISLVIWMVMVWFAWVISIGQHAASNVIPMLRGDYVRNQYRV